MSSADAFAFVPLLDGIATPAFDLTVVIPAYNESRRLPGTLDSLNHWVRLQPFSVEVIVVDDGSRDDTAARAAEHESGCGVIRLRHNRGKGSAVRTGLLLAQGVVAAFTDADLPYELTALEHAYRAIASGKTAVAYGSRDLNPSVISVRRPAAREIASQTFRIISSRLVSPDITDTQCGLKAFRGDVAKDIFSRVRTDGFAFDAEAILVARRLGLSAIRIPVVLVNDAGSTVSLRRHAPAMLWDLFKARLRHRSGAGSVVTDLPDYEILRTAQPQKRRVAA